MNVSRVKPSPVGRLKRILDEFAVERKNVSWLGSDEVHSTKAEESLNKEENARQSMTPQQRFETLKVELFGDDNSDDDNDKKENDSRRVVGELTA